MTSRNTFDNDVNQYEDNTTQIEAQKTLTYRSRETENKLRVDINKNINDWKIAYGTVAQVSEYDTKTFAALRRELKDGFGNIIQNAVTVNFTSPLNSFLRYGAFAQVSKRFFNSRLGISAGLRSDMNTFTTTGNNGLKTLSPRISASYILADKWTANASIGRYFKIAPYTILGFADNANNLVNKKTLKKWSGNHLFLNKVKKENKNHLKIIGRKGNNDISKYLLKNILTPYRP